MKRANEILKGTVGDALQDVQRGRAHDQEHATIAQLADQAAKAGKLAGQPVAVPARATRAADWLQARPVLPGPPCGLRK